MSPRPEVEGNQDRANGDEGDGVSRRAAVERVGCRRGERRHGEHLGEHGDAEDEVVGVEAIGIEGEADPRPPDGHEQERELQEAKSAVVDLQLVRDLADRDDEDQVDEQLEPARTALLVGVLDRSQPRRLEEARERDH